MSVLDNKRNDDFVQLYRAHMPEMRWLTMKNGTAASIMLFFMEHMDKKNALVCSYELLQDFFEISRATVYRAIKLLEDNGFIGILKSGNANVYVVNHEIAWTAGNNGKKYAKIDGVILVGHRENKDYEISRARHRFTTLCKRENIKHSHHGMTSTRTIQHDAETGEVL